MPRAGPQPPATGTTRPGPRTFPRAAAAASLGCDELPAQLGQSRLQQPQVMRRGLVLLRAGHLQQRGTEASAAGRTLKAPPRPDGAARCRTPRRPAGQKAGALPQPRSPRSSPKSRSSRRCTPACRPTATPLLGPGRQSAGAQQLLAGGRADLARRGGRETAGARAIRAACLQARCAEPSRAGPNRAEPAGGAAARPVAPRASVREKAGTCVREGEREEREWAFALTCKNLRVKFNVVFNEKYALPSTV